MHCSTPSVSSHLAQVTAIFHDESIGEVKIAPVLVKLILKKDGVRRIVGIVADCRQPDTIPNFLQKARALAVHSIKQLLLQIQSTISLLSSVICRHYSHVLTAESFHLSGHTFRFDSLGFFFSKMLFGREIT